MCAEDEAGQPQVHIVTPVPLPYTARSTAVLRSMMCKELQGTDHRRYMPHALNYLDETTPSPGIPLLDDLVPYCLSDATEHVLTIVL